MDLEYYDDDEAEEEEWLNNLEVDYGHGAESEAELSKYICLSTIWSPLVIFFWQNIPNF